MGEELKLLGTWGSRFSRRVEMALKIKGVSYEYLEQEIYHNKSALLLKHNPVHTKVPRAYPQWQIHCGVQVILEYIDETWKDNPILPQDPYERVMARFWAKFLDEKGPRGKRHMREACELLSTLEGELKGKKFFRDENIRFVDITADVLEYWVGVLEEVAGVDVVTEDNFPVPSRWAEDFRNCPVVKENLLGKNIKECSNNVVGL